MIIIISIAVNNFYSTRGEPIGGKKSFGSLYVYSLLKLFFD